MIFLNGILPLISLCLWIINILAIIDMYKTNKYNYLWVNYILFAIGIVSTIPSCILLIIFKLKYNNYIKHFEIMSKYLQF